MTRDGVARATGADMGGTGKGRGLTALGSMSISLVVLVVVACVQPPSSAAQTAPTPAASVPSRPRTPPPDELQLEPDQAPAPERPAPLLRRYIPGLQKGMEKLPAFIRDTDLNLHFRTFYFDRINPDDSVNEAWAIGGWLEYRSGWLWDTFAMGAVGYTSQPLYAPDDKDGTTLLAPGQEGITVLGQAYGQLRYRDYALLTGYRQMVDDGYVNSQDNRMLPNTFEGVTLKGKVGFVAYNVGYLWDIKPRNSDEFISMSQQAGGTGPREGLVLTSLTLTPWKPLNVYLGNDYVANVFNTVFGKAEYTHQLTEEWKLQLGLQVHGPAQRGERPDWRLQHLERGVRRPPVLAGARPRHGRALHRRRRQHPVALRDLARLPILDPDRIRPRRREGLGRRPHIRLRRDAPPVPGSRFARAPGLRAGHGHRESLDGKQSAGRVGG